MSNSIGSSPLPVHAQAAHGEVGAVRRIPPALAGLVSRIEPAPTRWSAVQAQPSPEPRPLDAYRCSIPAP